MDVGFLDLRLQAWIRNLLTRSLAIVPSLAVALIGGSARAGELQIIMILSLELPFPLIPLLKFTSCKKKTGPYANSTVIKTITWIIGFLLMGINIYFQVLLHSPWNSWVKYFSEYWDSRAHCYIWVELHISSYERTGKLQI
ncbi:hypothetical protein POM88_040372 [Heracleum sosnowskyi]|uniref:Uncharacterized protein n=1 Tax=Heracleum sosnowskyi TaxID=360622 RepID=A0AAD8HE09_9APIA|nr:hypothetical protein POM88_040372 [Heracleum sosnowskyi]